MIFSRTCEHAIRVVLFVATQPDGRPTGVPVIARALGVSPTALAKVVQTLTRHGVLASQKGPGGGVKLARPASDVTVLEIVRLVDGKDLERTCILGLPGCSEDGAHCPLHDRWNGMRDRIVRMLASPSIAGLAERLKNEDNVLARGTRRTSGAAVGSLGARGGRS